MVLDIVKSGTGKYGYCILFNLYSINKTEFLTLEKVNIPISVFIVEPMFMITSFIRETQFLAPNIYYNHVIGIYQQHNT